MVFVILSEVRDLLNVSTTARQILPHIRRGRRFAQNGSAIQHPLIIKQKIKMNRSTKFLLGAVIALATAGTLYATVGKQFHRHRYAMQEQWRHHHHYCDDEKEKNQQPSDSTKWK